MIIINYTKSFIVKFSHHVYESILPLTTKPCINLNILPVSKYKLDIIGTQTP